jgi:hypothetical protein
MQYWESLTCPTNVRIYQHTATRKIIRNFKIERKIHKGQAYHLSKARRCIRYKVCIVSCWWMTWAKMKITYRCFRINEFHMNMNSFSSLLTSWRLSLCKVSVCINILQEISMNNYKMYNSCSPQGVFWVL